MKKNVLLVIVFLINLACVNAQDTAKIERPSFYKIIKEYAIELKDTISFKNEVLITGTLLSSSDSIDIFTNATIITLDKNGYEVYKYASARLFKTSDIVDYFYKSSEYINMETADKISNEGFFYCKYDFNLQIIVTNKLKGEKIFSKQLKNLEANKKIDF